MNILDLKDFYPTPIHIINKMLEGIDWLMVDSILEPSAGKGDICNIVLQKLKAHSNRYYSNEKELKPLKNKIDTIEINPQLQHILRGEGYKVIHDDFLTFNTYKKYSLIVANFPFSEGEKHLLKAFELQKDGGTIICLLNAETIKNPYTNARKTLVKMLEDYNSSIEYLPNAFIDAERKTGVEVALIKINIPEAEKVSFIFEGLKQEEEQEQEYIYNSTELTAYESFLHDIIAQYNREVKLGIRLIKEYSAARPYMMNTFNKEDKYGHCLLSLGLYGNDNRYTEGVNANEYIKKVREVYWTTLFKSPQFVEKLTSNLKESLHNKVAELVDYDFSMFNIKSIQIELTQQMTKGVEETILNLFEELSNKHHYYDELSNNIHLFNGWKTNKAYKINKKVIIPLNAWGHWGDRYEPEYYNSFDKLADIEKVFNYLDNGKTENVDLYQKLKEAGATGQTKKIDTKYFLITFYKKGTCHLEFKDMDLLDKFNIFGCQRKNWLPPTYGKKRYKDMTPEEKTVINEFEGEEKYNRVYDNTKYFIFTSSNIMMLEQKQADVV